MTNVAIIAGNANYNSLPPLLCCNNDVASIKALIEATGKYDTIAVLGDATAASLRDSIRSAIDSSASIDEVFFYFSGHGDVQDGEFYFCGTDYDSDKPNETGLSTNLLHVLVRAADAKLVVKVIDACYSGVPLIKDGRSPFPEPKAPLKNVIQIASCLDSQSSFTGDPLSVFTAHFIDAALSKTDGIVYYSDIVAFLRDRFIDNTLQTPYFISQGTGREQFVSDATLLHGLRPRTADEPVTEPVDLNPAPAASLLDRLRAADAQYVTQEAAQTYVDALRTEITSGLRSRHMFSDYFTLSERSSNYYPSDSTVYGFMARVLSREQRPDRFVTAEHERKRKRTDPFSATLAASGVLAISPDDYYDNFIVSNNSSITNVALEIEFQPLYLSLDRFILNVCIAPSLTTCYVFETLSRHARSDWNKFDSDGAELKRRWFRLRWDETPANVISQICDNANQQIREYIEKLAAEPGAKPDT
ncbi:caspase family protein [Devosia sp.]|uniref:caspase family protein n=1 Tax=Devosia sp. TaxID=1871048 RepID=UPI003F71194E